MLTRTYKEEIENEIAVSDVVSNHKANNSVIREIQEWVLVSHTHLPFGLTVKYS